MKTNNNKVTPTCRRAKIGFFMEVLIFITNNEANFLKVNYLDIFCLNV